MISNYTQIHITRPKKFPSKTSTYIFSFKINDLHHLILPCLKNINNINHLYNTFSSPLKYPQSVYPIQLRLNPNACVTLLTSTPFYDTVTNIATGLLHTSEGQTTEGHPMSIKLSHITLSSAPTQSTHYHESFTSLMCHVKIDGDIDGTIYKMSDKVPNGYFLSAEHIADKNNVYNHVYTFCKKFIGDGGLYRSTKQCYYHLGVES